MSLVILAGVDDELEEAVREAIPGHDVRVRAGETIDATGFKGIASQGPAVVVLGPKLGERHAFEVAERFDRHHPAISVMVATEPGPDTWPAAVAAGVRGIIAPGTEPAELRTALEQALEAAHRHPGANLQAGAPRGTVITVISPKGGAGKTVFSTNLAVALATHAPRDVVLVDLDLQFGDSAYALMLTPEHSMLDAVSALVERDAATLKVFLTPHQSGIFTLCAPDEPAAGDDIAPEQTAAVIRTLSEEFSYVVVDTGGGIGEHTLTALEESTDIVLISDMDVPSVRNLRKAVDVLDVLGMTSGRRHFVLNRADSRVGLTTEDVASAAGMRIDVELPSSRHVPISLNQGRPLMFSHPRSPVARRIAELAEQLTGVPAPAGKRKRR
jgi:pilus assembly protein CpaE